MTATATQKATLNMVGPFNLTEAEIDKQVTKKSPGNYALGDVRDGTFYVDYVGRADVDLNKRLKDWVGKYKQFKYSYAASAQAAFEKECNNYHDFKPPHNVIHPARPENSKSKCPRCNALD